jgi:predicted aspartyl protease
MTRFMTAAGCAALTWLIAQPAMAACALSTQPIAVILDGGERPVVTAKVNGKSGRFLVDSSSAVNQISSKFAASQKLATSQAAGGGPTIAKAPKFEFAGASLSDVPFAVSEKLVDIDGVIGQTLLHQGDVEYDLAPPAGPAGPAAAPSGGKKGAGGPAGGFGPAVGTVKLAKAVGCEGANMAYWAKDGDVFYEAALAPPANGAPFTQVDIVVNGVKLRGLLATGKAYTTITVKAAAKAGVKTTDAGVSPLGAGGSVKTWKAAFNSVIVGNEEIKNEPLEIDEANDDFYDVLIGADFFSTHHLYVANSQQKIYFTRAGLPGPTFKVHEQKRPPVGEQLQSGAGIHVSGP